MGPLRRAIMLIAAMFIFASPSSAKVVKFEILKVESPAFEGRTFGAVGTHDEITARATQGRLLAQDAGLFIANSN